MAPRLLLTMLPGQVIILPRLLRPLKVSGGVETKVHRETVKRGAIAGIAAYAIGAIRVANPHFHEFFFDQEML